jgi:hypothetical protein
MKIRRPEEKSGGKSITLDELTRYATEVAQARISPPGQGGPARLLSSGRMALQRDFQAMIGSSDHVDTGFNVED